MIETFFFSLATNHICLPWW